MVDINNIQSTEIEKSILGALLNSTKCFLLANEKRVNGDMFYSPRHKKIYKAIKKFNEKQKINVNEFDFITFLDNNKNNINEFGGLSYLNEIKTEVLSTVAFEAWVDKLINYHEKRKLLDISTFVQKNIEKDNQELENYIENELLKLYDKKDSDDENIFFDIIEMQEKLQNGEEKGLQTGIRELDRSIHGFFKTELITIFARSGVGKSTLAIQIALNMLRNNRILYVSNEMTKKEVYDKMFASYNRIDITKCKTGTLTDNEFTKYIDFMGKLSNKTMRVISEPNINTLISKIKLFKLKYGLDIVFIDYINLITEGAVGENTTTKLGYIASKLKQLAMDENICVVLLAQAKRDTDKENKNKAIFEKVENGDIQDSARIEQYSNTILSLYRNLKLDNKVARKILAEEGKIDYNSKNPDENPGVATITINKARLGNKTTVSVAWNGEFSRINNFER